MGRVSACKLFALGQSCQLSVTLDWHFVFIAQTEADNKEYSCRQEAGMCSYNNLHAKNVRPWTMDW